MNLRIRRLTGAGIILGLGALSTVPLGASAGAQIEPEFRVSPFDAVVGQTLQIFATGCVAQGVDQSNLAVVVSSGALFGNGPYPTDADGGVLTFSEPLRPETAGQQYSFSATCMDFSGTDPVPVFIYGQLPLVHVQQLPETTSTTAPAETPTPVGISPAFTG